MTMLPDDCRTARRALLTREDGLLPAVERDALERHLAECADCLDRAVEIEATLGALRTLPSSLPFPDDALESIWNRTIRTARPGGAPVARFADGEARALRRSRAAGWRLALAAAALLAAVLGPWLAFRAREGAAPASLSAAASLSPEEQRAAAELVLVLRLTDRALQRSQRAAVDGVLRRGIDPALRRVPVLREIVPDRPSSRDGSVETVR
jgi:anti-sigma factor RsiW